MEVDCSGEERLQNQEEACEELYFKVCLWSSLVLRLIQQKIPKELLLLPWSPCCAGFFYVPPGGGLHKFVVMFCVQSGFIEGACMVIERVSIIKLW